MNARTRKCPMCAEMVPAEAIFCPFCATRLGDQIPAPASAPAPVPLPASLTVQPPPTAAAARKAGHAGWWIAGGAAVLLILVCVIGLLLWTQRSSLPALTSLLSTPTASATLTLPPTPTFTPTATHLPTSTILPSPTIDPATGTVIGVIQWGDQPYEGVTVKLCTDWFYTCRGTEYTAITNAEGTYTFTEIEPGEYQFITQAPGQSDEIRLETFIFQQGYRPILVTVIAGEVVRFQSVSACKYDLVLHPPTIQGGSVTFSWDPYPGATSYDLRVRRPDGSAVIQAHDVPTTSYTDILSPGTYRWLVSVNNMGCVTRAANITMP
jgi:hypothetical protein